MGEPTNRVSTPKHGPRALRTATLSCVNDGILEFARDSIGEEEWEFFCECCRKDCHAFVSLTVGAYVALRDNGGGVLAAGHRLNPAERARRPNRLIERDGAGL